MLCHPIVNLLYFFITLCSNFVVEALWEYVWGIGQDGSGGIKNRKVTRVSY